MGQWRTLTSHVVYENRWMVVHEDQVINPAGNETIYGYVESKSDAVYIVAIDDESYTYITNQFRYTLGKESWECPAGRCEGDDVITAAKRELLEETGMTARDITPLATVNVANGISTFRHTVCLAEGLTKTTDTLDEIDGILAAKRLPLDDVIAMVMDGRITCSQSISAFMMVREHITRRNHGSSNH